MADARDKPGARPVRITQLSKSFGGKPVLDALDLEIPAGQFVALLGHSGSGKSTLLRILAGLDSADSGRAEVPDVRTVVFQEPRLIPWMRARDNVTFALRAADSGALAERALQEVGLAHRLDAWPLTLSGGEAQRVALARALVRSPQLLLLDEPFAALDALTRARMHVLVQKLFEDHRPAVLLVTHDVDEAVMLADRVLVLQDGAIVQDHTVSTPRPRQRDDARMLPLKQQLLAALGVPTLSAAA